MSTNEDESKAESAVFEYITEPVENVQDYVSGGLHPVCLGDTLDDGRYTILRKLGYGGYSTVWLAQDNRANNTFVALKIARADGDYTKEVEIHNVLRANANQHPGYASIVMLRDHFSIPGPNGDHDCLVYDALGPSIAHVRDGHTGLSTVAWLTLPSARKIVYQVLLGLDYMHSMGVVHGDLYAANVLFAIQDLSHEPIEALCQSRDDVSAAVKRVSGSRQPGDPQHLTLNRPLERLISSDAEVKLSDLGNSFLEDNAPTKLETPAEIRSPEMILNGHVSKAQDCWAFGCLVYNVLTNGYPFDLGFMSGGDSRNDTHLIQLCTLLGPLPIKLKDSWPRHRLYFNDQGELEKFEVDDDFDTEDAFYHEEVDNMPDDNSPSITSDTVDEGLDQKVEGPPSVSSATRSRNAQDSIDDTSHPSIIKISERKKPLGQTTPNSLAEYHALNPPLRERWSAEQHPDLDSKESELILDLIQGLFVWDPAQRLSTKELLNHAWIRDYCAPSDSEADIDHPREPTDRQKKRKLSGVDEKLLQSRKKSID